jgi:glycosyltransferase involved in cell wall biosynthesis
MKDNQERGERETGSASTLLDSVPASHSSSFPSVSVCFPAYDEETTINEVLQEAHSLLSDSGLNYEILVCNDGSSDGTGETIERLARRIPRLRVLQHERNLGIRATFEHLYQEASLEFVFLNSADRQWKTSLLFDMLPLTKDWDVIIASRKDKHYGFVRQVVSWGFNAIPFLLFGVRTFDAGAVKLVRREIIERFSIVSQSPFSEAERLIRAARAGYRITEWQVGIARRQTGTARGVSSKSVIEALKDIARVWWALRQERIEK